MTGADAVFIDSNVLIAASVLEHPSHDVAKALLARLADAAVVACISPQVCREFLSVMTRAPVEGREFLPSEALAVLAGWLADCALIEENAQVLTELTQLVARFAVRGKKVHDANVVATMAVWGIDRLTTFNGSDFRRYEPVVTLEAISS